MKSTLPDQSYAGKRVVDLVLLAILAVPAAAVGLPCALAIRLTSRGPVFFLQERVGLDGRLFKVVKFRTMHSGAEPNPVFPDPASTTRVGRWLRRLSLDELPQLIKVAKGDMSIVGPRPTLPYQVERYSERERGRLAVRPGVTGLAQVKGRNSISWARRIEYDLEYIRRQSVWLDLRIVFLSLAAIVKGGGVEGHPRDDPLAKA